MILGGEKGNHNVLATTTERSSGEPHKPVWIQTRCGARSEVHKENKNYSWKERYVKKSFFYSQKEVRYIKTFILLLEGEISKFIC